MMRSTLIHSLQQRSVFNSVYLRVTTCGANPPGVPLQAATTGGTGESWHGWES